MFCVNKVECEKHVANVGNSQFGTLQERKFHFICVRERTSFISCNLNELNWICVA